jgi:polysaccharide export outer membrane protein
MMRKICNNYLAVAMIICLVLNFAVHDIAFSSEKAGADTIKLIEKGDNVKESIMEITEIKGYPYVQLKDFCHFYRIDIKYNPATKGVILKKNGKKINVSTGVNYFYAENRKVKIESEPVIVDGRILVPVELFEKVCTILFGKDYSGWGTLKKNFTVNASPAVSFWEDYNQMANVKEKNVITQGDIIEISVWQKGSFEFDELTREREVQNDGSINFPFIGKIYVEGINCNQLEKRLTGKLKSYIKNPEVNVRIKEDEQQVYKVQIFGEVRSPGRYEFKDRATLIEAINMAGGFKESANMSKVRLTRNVHHSPYETEIVDCKLIICEGQRQYDIPVAENDIVYVPKSKGFFGFIPGGLTKITPLLSTTALPIGVIMGARSL